MSGPEIFEAQREANRLVRERVEAAFRRLCDPAKMAVRDVYEEGDPGDLLAEAAHGADLTVVAQEGGTGLDALGPQPIHHVILSAGGPVLVLPRAGLGATLGQRVVVAWNGSREAARAAKDALPFLAAAESVTLIAAGEDASASLDAGTALLKRHGAMVDDQAGRARPWPGRHAARGRRGRRCRPAGDGRLRPLAAARDRARRCHARGTTRRAVAGPAQLLRAWRRDSAQQRHDQQCQRHRSRSRRTGKGPAG